MKCTKLSTSCNGFNDCCSSHVKEITQYTVKLFEEFGIEYWLDYNCLAAAIENKIFPDRNIIGISCQYADKLEALAYRIYEDGYFLTLRKSGFAHNFKITYSFSNDTGIDIWDWSVARGRAFRKLETTDRNIMFNEKYISKFEEVEYFGIKAKCPKDYKKFLNERL